MNIAQLASSEIFIFYLGDGWVGDLHVCVYVRKSVCVCEDLNADLYEKEIE